jgi:SAM-dependent methyltransferase
LGVFLEDVQFAYRLLLGREPSEQEATAWLGVPSLAELRKHFFESYEFRAIAFAAARDKPRLPFDLGPLTIEWQTDPDTEKTLLDYVKTTWTKLGENEPHWSVLSSDEFKSVNITEHYESFYASGATDARLIAAVLERHGIPEGRYGRILEYGCGVGRATTHIAKLFREVVAVDISASHLSLAEKTVIDAGCRNVRFLLGKTPDFGMEESFDLFFSYIVLQHNPPPVIALVLRRMFKYLLPEGLAIFQVPTYVPGYRFNVAQYLLEPKLETIEMHCFPQQVIFQMARDAGCICLEVREDAAMDFPWLSNTFVFKKPR